MTYVFPAAEPYRIKMVEPLKITTREHRQEILQQAHYNMFSIPAEDVYVDLLTDSGTSAMSQEQWAGIMIGDESYAGSRSWFHLEATIKELTGYRHVLPTHQGRPAENILTRILVHPGHSSISNMFFDTTQANVLTKGGIARDEMFSYADGCTMSAKKDGLVNIGGFLALNDERVYQLGQQYLIQMEGFLTYGGLAGRDLEALARGLTEVLDESYMANRIRQVNYLGEQLLAAGVPAVRPIGGHCVMLDMKRFLPQLRQDVFPAEAFCAALYLDSGTRAVGLGELAFGSVDAQSGQPVHAALELVRLAIPRRVYTDNHMNVVARSVIRLSEQREALRGMRIVSAPAVLRHFTAQLEPM